MIPQEIRDWFKDAESTKETHISWVFLGKDEVWKIKRPVRYPFVDYSTPELRRHFCEEEVRLNRRLAPGVYLGVVPLPRGEYAVRMRRLPDRASAAECRLDFGHMEELARLLARFYAAAPPASDPFRKNLEDNFIEMEPFVGACVDRATFEEVRAFQLGFARPPRPSVDGHGDLRLEHAYFLEEGTVIIDCVEFADRFRHGDPACDAAFLAMELDARGRRDLSSWFLACFARETGDYELFRVIDLYLGYRAWVRAKIACLMSRPTDLFRLALDYARPREGGPVIAVGGLIGAGKTTVAEALSRALACPVISADRVRERVAPGDYGEAANERTYGEMLRLASVVVDSGRGVILDSTFRRQELRRRANPQLFVEVTASEETLRRRLEGRRDSKWIELLPRMKREFEPVKDLPHIVISTDGPLDLGPVLERIRMASRLRRDPS